MKLVILAAFSTSITVGIILYSLSKGNMKNISFEKDLVKKEIKSPEEHQRPADQTFLTFPEWFLVFSPEEFAVFSERSTPDAFPFFGHIAQFWQAYGDVYKVIKDKYPFNTGYHIMIMVIGGSTTVEYFLRACYEKTVGKISRMLSSDALTDEDRYAAEVARAYVDFIKVLPWYEFNFKDKLKKLWSLPRTGDNFIRKWERRYVLTTEYSAKAIYGWLIKKMTKASYEDPLPVTSVITDKSFALSDTSEIKFIKQFADGSALYLLPRYDAFKGHVLTLARNNINTLEIAGNQDVILITYIVPSKFEKSGNTTVLFTQTILSDPSKKRIALIVPVGMLSNTMRIYDKPDITLEHVYDF